MGTDQLLPRRRPSRRRFLGAAGGTGAAAGAAALVAAGGSPAGPPATGSQGAAGRAEVLAAKRDVESRGATWAGDAPLGARRVIWDVATTAPLLALTFDDGPDPRYTPRVLDALSAAGARATFFMTGAMLERHPRLGRRVLDEGHEVGNHTWSHQNLTFLDDDGMRREIEEGDRALREVLGVRSPWFRPPRGQLPGAALRIAAELGQDVCIWSASRRVEGVGRPAEVAAAIVAGLRPGAVVDLHDSIGRGNFLPAGSPARRELEARRDVEVDVLGQVLDAASAAGLRSVTLGELVAVASSPGALGPPVSSVALAPGPTTTPPR